MVEHGKSPDQEDMVKVILLCRFPRSEAGVVFTDFLHVTYYYHPSPKLERLYSLQDGITNCGNKLLKHKPISAIGGSNHNCFFPMLNILVVITGFTEDLPI